MKVSMILSIIAMLLLAAGGGLLSAEEPNMSDNSYEKYTVIAQRNIFSKDRRPPREERPSRERVRRTQVLSIYVLRGIAGQPGERVAFIEEQISGQTLRANVGTELLDGEITDIKYDRVAYEQNGRTRYIKVGGEFGKTETTVIAEASENESQEVVTPPTAPADSNAVEGDESDILKRLMERRRNELGQ
jgi:type II secretory pathway component PulC